MRRHLAPGGLVAVVVLVLGCHGEEAPAAEREGQLQDGAALREALLADPALPLLLEVRDVIERDLPARASELLADTVIPAARRQVDRVAECPARTPAGRALRARAVDAYRARLEALRAYQSALARGPVEDLRLLDAVASLRASEEELAAVHAAVARLAEEAPVPVEGEPGRTR